MVNQWGRREQKERKDFFKVSKVFQKPRAYYTPPRAKTFFPSRNEKMTMDNRGSSLMMRNQMTLTIVSLLINKTDGASDLSFSVQFTTHCILFDAAKFDRDGTFGAKLSLGHTSSIGRLPRNSMTTRRVD
jgi:hypothetical protein